MRKTLSTRAPVDNPAVPRPPAKGRNIAASRLDTLHDTARAMRRSPTEAQTLLAEALVKAELGKYRFRRYAVIGSVIVDFACLPLKVAVQVEEPDANSELGQRSDRILADGGIKVLRFAAAEVIADVDAVTAAIVAELKNRWVARRARPSAPNRNTERSRPHPGGRGYER